MLLGAARPAWDVSVHDPAIASRGSPLDRRHRRWVAHGSTLARCASASRCPSRSSAQKRARFSAQRRASSSPSIFAAMGPSTSRSRPARRHNDRQRRASACRRRFRILVHPRKLGRSPSAVVASRPCREHRLSIGVVRRRREIGRLQGETAAAPCGSIRRRSQATQRRVNGCRGPEAPSYNPPSWTPT